MFAGDNNAIFGDMDSMNKAYSTEQDSDWFLFIEKLNQFIDPNGLSDDSAPIHQLWVMMYQLCLISKRCFLQIIRTSISRRWC